MDCTELFHADLMPLARWIDHQSTSDVVLIVTAPQDKSSRHFHAHRIVLASWSDYFHSMLFGQHREAVQKEITIELPENTSTELFAEVLGYMYTCRITITGDNVTSLTLLAGFLQIEALQQGCLVHIKNGINTNSVCELLGWAADAQQADLAAECRRYIAHHFMEVAKHDRFGLIPRQQLEMILEDDNLDASQICVYQSMVAWSRFKDRGNKIGPSDDLQTLLAKVRLHEMTDTDILDIVYPHGLVSKKNLLDALVKRRKADLSVMWSRAMGITGSTLLISLHRYILADWTEQAKWHLLYRKSRDGATAQDFHRLCDNQGPTLTVIQLTDRSVIGGFTPVAWISTNMSHWDRSLQSFLFYMDSNGSHAVRAQLVQSIATTSDAGGPKFGASDLHVDAHMANIERRQPTSYDPTKDLVVKPGAVIRDIEVFGQL